MRHFGDTGTSEPAPEGDGVIFETEYADPRAIVSWVLGLREHARILDPPELAKEAAERLGRIVELHSTGPELARAREEEGRAGRGARTRTASARRRSGPSASPGSSRSPAS